MNNIEELTVRVNNLELDVKELRSLIEKITQTTNQPLKPVRSYDAKNTVSRYYNPLDEITKIGRKLSSDSFDSLSPEIRELERFF